MRHRIFPSLLSLSLALGLCVLLLGFWMPDGVEKLLRASAALIGG